MVVTSACACGGVGPIATGTGPLRPTMRGHLDDGVLVEEGQRGAVGGVEDHDRAGVVGDRLDQAQRLALVAAGLAAVVVLVRDTGGAARLGHVGAVALVAGGAPGAERRGRVLAVLGVEGGLRLEQVRPPRLVLLPDRRHRVRTEVEVVQVLVRDHPERAQPVASEQAPLLEAGERRVVGEQLRQPVAAGVRGRLQPAEVVEAEVVEPHLVGLVAERAGDAPAQRRRRVADADHAVAEHLADGLRDHAGRVGEVDQPRPRRPLGDRLGELEHRGDRAQREADAARPGGLLAEHAEAERHRLVDDAALEAADPDRAEDEVGALDGVAEVGRDAERQRVPVLGGEPVQHGAHALEAAGVDVVQDDLVERQPVAPGQQRAVHERDAEPAATDDRELHAEDRRRRGPNVRPSGAFVRWHETNPSLPARRRRRARSRRRPPPPRSPPSPPGSRASRCSPSATQVTFTQPLTSKVSVKGVKAGRQRDAPAPALDLADVVRRRDRRPRTPRATPPSSTRPRRNDYYRAIARTTPEQIERRVAREGRPARRLPRL